MRSLDEIRQRSLSTEELVVPYEEAMDALALLREAGVKVLGWEGWLSFRNGGTGHSSRHQGTGDLSSLSPAEACALVMDTIEKAHAEWRANPEAPDAALYFCITVGT